MLELNIYSDDPNKYSRRICFISKNIICIKEPSEIEKCGCIIRIRDGYYHVVQTYNEVYVALKRAINA